MSARWNIKSLPRLGVASLIFIALNLGAALYRSKHQNASITECAPEKAAVSRMAPLARGEVAAVNVTQDPKTLPALHFMADGDKKLTLKDFSGRTILLNLWATWCVPCRTEMPTLDQLQAKLGGTDFEVVAVNIDQRNLDRPKQFLADAGVTHLAYYSDPSADTFQSLKTIGKAFGMPTTMIISPHGCELGTIAGPADWKSDDALALVRAALGR